MKRIPPNREQCDNDSIRGAAIQTATETPAARCTSVDIECAREETKCNEGVHPVLCLGGKHRVRGSAPLQRQRRTAVDENSATVQQECP